MKKRATRGRSRVAYVWRYNPDSTTGRATRVRADSPEAQDWPSRKPTAAQQRAKRELPKISGKVAEAAVKAVFARKTGGRTGAAAAVVGAGVSRRLASAVATRVAAARLPVKEAVGVAGLIPTAAAVAAAFGIGYAIGTGLRTLWQRLQPSERNYRKALAFLAARRKFAQEQGREMTAAEVREMGRGFKESLS